MFFFGTGVERRMKTLSVSKIAEKLHRAISAPLEYMGENLKVGASIGIAFLNIERMPIDMIYKRADIAMYQAKKYSLKYVIFFDQK